MRMLAACTLAGVMAIGVAVAQADEVKSGPQVGQSIGAFNVVKVAGGDDGVNVGARLCYTWRLGARPVVMIFTRKSDDALAGLVKEIDRVVAANEDKKMAAFVNFIGADADSLEGTVKQFGEKTDLKRTALVVPVDAQSGPRNFSLSDDADVTVVVYSGKKVQANHALKGDELTDEKVRQIVADAQAAAN